MSWMVRTVVFLVVLAGWGAGWVAVAASGAVEHGPLWAWLLLLVVSAGPVELVYRRTRPGVR